MTKQRMSCRIHIMKQIILTIPGKHEVEHKKYPLALLVVGSQKTLLCYF